MVRSIAAVVDAANAIHRPRAVLPQIIYLSELVYTDVVTPSFQLASRSLSPRSAGEAPVMRAKTAADRLFGLDAGDWSILVLGVALTGLLVALF